MMQFTLTTNRLKNRLKYKHITRDDLTLRQEYINKTMSLKSQDLK